MPMQPPQSASALFAPWELTIDSWASLQSTTNDLTSRYRSRDMVWRGTRRAEWGVMSSLYRSLIEVLYEPPTEDQMIAAEKRTLEFARRDWRFDGMPALETMAHLQHFGAPTRLLDVSENPLIALWFAVESRAGDDGSDGRLFAFVTNERPIRLNSSWYGRYPRWHELRTDDARRAVRWGTGLGRRVWCPPAFNSRISSQSAGFVVDGVPLEAQQHGLGRKNPDLEATWTADEMRQSNSIPLKVTTIRRGDLPPEAAPVFTFRIEAKAKDEIREQLERRYGYRASSIYSDMSGLADFLRARPELLLRDRA